MKFLGQILTVTSVVLMGIVGAAAQDENTVINAITTIGDASNRVQVQVSQLDDTNIADQGPVIVEGLQNITTTTTQFTDTIKAITTPFPASPAEEIATEFQGFVAVNTALLNSIIEQHPLVSSQEDLDASFADALDDLQLAIDSFSHAVIDLVPTEEDTVDGLLAQLDQSFAEAISTYES